eukprot:7085445-Pyramimonas_sp.AAC.1
MGHVALVFGSPVLWGCWAEGGVNKWLARVSNVARRMAWSRRVLAEFNAVWGPGNALTRPH